MAETILREALNINPQHADTNHLLGLVTAHMGQHEVARQFLIRAIKTNPGRPDFHNNLGLILFRQDLTDEALLAYDNAISLNPAFAEAHSNRGNLLWKTGKLTQALAACDRAIELKPDYAEARNTRGNILWQQGRYAEALTAYDHALRTNPHYADAHKNRGNVLWNLGRLEESLEACNSAIRLKPDYAAPHNNRGNTLQSLGRLEESLVAYDKAISLAPAFAEAHSNRGNLLWKAGKLTQALAACDRAIELLPGYAEAHNNRGNVLWGFQRFDEALAAYDHALQITPDYPEAHNNRANVLRDLDRPEESLAASERAIKLRPDYAKAITSRGNILSDLGQLDGAVDAFEQAIRYAPALAEAHYALALLLLLRGELARGWQEHEWRWQVSKFTSPRRNFTAPQWQGEPLQGKTILLHTEQGHGDTIQAIRYVSRVTGYGGKIVVECRKPLIRLLSSMPGIDQLVEYGKPLPDFETQAPLLSLPFILKTTLKTIPADIPYLSPPVGIAPEIDQLALNDNTKNIGLVWAGNPKHQNDRHRSVAPRLIKPLLEVPECRWFSLQVGERALDPGATPGFDDVVDTSPLITDYAVTAALVKRLDLVITVDTSVAHLAGALGRPAWILLPFMPDWRWLLDRDDSPWYPSLRLFRQPTRGDWVSVIEKIRRELETFCSGNKNREE